MRLELQQAQDGDLPFLTAVYASTRDDLDGVPWSDEEKAEFVAMQSAAQQADYRRRFPSAEQSLVTLDDAPIGRLWVHRAADEIRILDITILPDARSRGVGTALITQLIEEARADAKPLRHSVFRDNTGARRLYERLGFTVVEDFDAYLLMEWRPP